MSESPYQQLKTKHQSYHLKGFASSPKGLKSASE